ncbi:MAG: hypothetical protein JNL67_04850 [Planctomycetaceae bacterium]|nr:hypothetical protein [Planctomycetaceae bacterium]
MSWLRYAWLAILLIAVALLLQRWPHEIKQWQLALAAESQLNGNGIQSLERLQRLSEADPENLDLQLACLERQIDLQLDKPAWELLSKLEANEALLPLQRQRLASQLHRMQQHESAYKQLQKAFRDFEKGLQADVKENETTKKAEKESRELTAYEKVFWTNALAYAAYLSDRDLESQFVEINLVLRQTGLDDQFAIYRSQALRYVGRSEEGLQHLRVAIRNLERRLDDENQLLSERLGIWMSQSEWPGAEEPRDVRQIRSNVLEIRSTLRHLYHQGWELCQDVGDDPGRKEYKNNLVVMTAGLEHVALDLSPQAVAQQLMYIAGFLDTRGALATKIKNWRRAKSDLDAAIQAAYLARAISLDTGLANTPTVVDHRVIRELELSSDHSLAVFHYHRALLMEAMQGRKAAYPDLSAVRTLGHDAGPELH